MEVPLTTGGGDGAPRAKGPQQPACAATKKEIVTNLLAGATTSFAAIALGAAFGDASGRGALVGILSAEQESRGVKTRVRFVAVYFL